MTKYLNPLEGKTAPIVSFFHFHQQANGRTYLVKPLRRSDICDTDKCRFLVAENVETRAASEVLGLARSKKELFLTDEKGVRDISPALVAMQKIAKESGISFALGYDDNAGA